jgi:bifunctional UDP-N-acetylglucosamine pyrophosphorylase/glucosamine-1-phosphate N-acetyltransferase
VATVAGEPEIAAGINDREQLAAADAIARDRIRRCHMRNGVTIVVPETVVIDDGVTIGQDTTIEPFTVIRRGSSIGERCTVGPHAVLERARLGYDDVVRSTTLTDASVSDGSDVGPYAHLRGQTAIGSNVHIGNFAEINRSVIEERVKVGHVSYLGDAHVGAGTNIGAGAITCNFDGERKHRTNIGRDVFVGSDSMLVAPLTLGDGARTGAGSVVTKDVAAGSTVVGVPARAIRRRDVSGKRSAPEEREDNAS